MKKPKGKNEFNRAKQLNSNKILKFRVIQSMEHSTAVAEIFRDSWEGFRSISSKPNGMRL